MAGAPTCKKALSRAAGGLLKRAGAALAVLLVALMLSCAGATKIKGPSIPVGDKSTLKPHANMKFSIDPPKVKVYGGGATLNTQHAPGVSSTVRPCNFMAGPAFDLSRKNQSLKLAMKSIAQFTVDHNTKKSGAGSFVGGGVRVQF